MEEEVTSGIRPTFDRQDDSLSAALGNKEHTGRVRGRGVYTGWKDVYEGPKPKRRPRNKVNKDEMESRLAQVREEVRQEIRMDYEARMAEMESRLQYQMSQIQPAEHQSPISPAGVRRSSQASGTESPGNLDNLKVITTCS